MKKLIAIIILIVPFLTIAQNDQIDKGKELFESGKSEYQQNNYDEASIKLKSAIELDDTKSDYYLWLGKAYLAKLDKSSFFEKGILSGKVIDNYKKAIKIEPANIVARIHLANYYIYAPSIAGGSTKKAKEQAVEINKYNPEQALMLNATIYSREGNTDLAIEEYTKYLELNPDDPDAYYQVGMFYQGLKKYADATEMFEMAISKDDKAYGSLYQIGRTAIFSGQNIDRGITCFKEYIKVSPGSPYPGIDSAHWRLGMLYEKKGKKKLAKKEYSTAVELSPDEIKYKDALENIG